MKRKLSILLAILLVLSLAGCATLSAHNLNPQTAPALLTKAEAKTISLEQAKVNEADITNFEIALDEDDGVVYYDIGFNCDGAEYNYEIDANSGKVISCETERLAEAETPAAQTEAPTEAATKTKILVSPTSKKSIGLDAAKAAAFKHAEVKSSKVQDLEVELDNEKGSLQYEISFNAGSLEYDYHIDAYTGEVLHNEKERND